MRSLTLFLLLAACAHAGHDSAFAAAGAVKKAEGGGGFHTAQLKPMTEDVEILAGDPEKPGELFIMRIRELPGTIIPVHAHPVDEHITVLQGTFKFSVGDRWDESALRTLHAGDYAFAPKGSSMFGASPDGAVVQIQGIGPFLIHWAHPVGSLDDPATASRFAFHKGDHVSGPRGSGVVREGYSSGEIVQYVVETPDGSQHMANESDLKR